MGYRRCLSHQTIYRYTAEECVGMLRASPIFLENINDDDLNEKLETFGCWREIKFIKDEDGNFHDVDGVRYCYAKEVYFIKHSSSEFLGNFIKQYGCRCFLCSNPHYNSYADCCQRIGASATDILSKKIRISSEEDLPYYYIPPLCEDCMASAAKRLWKTKGGLLSKIERPSFEEEEIATLQWLSEEVLKLAKQKAA